MEEHMQLDVTITVGQKMRRKWRRKNLPYITVKRMNFEEYHGASEIILTGLEVITKQLHDAGYDLAFRGEQVVLPVDDQG